MYIIFLNFLLSLEAEINFKFQKKNKKTESAIDFMPDFLYKNISI